MEQEREKSIGIIYSELIKYDEKQKLEVLRDCGLSYLVDRHKVILGKESFKIILKSLIGRIINKSGDKINGATWKGIYKTIIKEHS